MNFRNTDGGVSGGTEEGPERASAANVSDFPNTQAARKSFVFGPTDTEAYNYMETGTEIPGGGGGGGYRLPINNTLSPPELDDIVLRWAAMGDIFLMF